MHEGLLRSPIQDDYWPGGIATQAACEKGHDAPEYDCTCGIYAMREAVGLFPPHVQLRYLWGSEIMLFGEVALWGKVIEHDNGFRATYAYPTRIYLPQTLWPYAKTLGKLYDVPTHAYPAEVFAYGPAMSQLATGQRFR